MSYQFSNNWPYSETLFPTMEDHIDPVNNTYFTGLHLEVQRIQFFLGLHPQGAYANVKARLDNFRAELGDNPEEGFASIKDKLENHGHTGGTDGKRLEVPWPDVWEGVDWVGTVEVLTIEMDLTGLSRAGFAYYNFVYLAPCDNDVGNRKIRSFNTINDEHFWQDSITNLQPRGAVFFDPWGVFSIAGSPGKMLRFNPETWEQVLTDLNTGVNFPGHLVKVGNIIWGGSYTSPAYIFNYDPNTHGKYQWVMDSGENEILAVCSDGSFIYAACNTDPVKLLKFQISTKTHIARTLTGFSPEVVYMTMVNGMVWLFSNNNTPQYVRFNPATNQYQRFFPDWPVPVRAGARWGKYIILTLSDVPGSYLAIFDPDRWMWWLSTNYGYMGEMKWITIANNHAVWAGDSDANTDYEAPISEPPG